jgi:hypothetical protein
MAVTGLTQGTLTTDASEQTLADTSAAATYTLDVDTNDMVDGDTIEIRIYKMVLTSGTRRVCYYAKFDDIQPADDKIKVSVPISTALTDSGAIRFTITGTTTSGTISLPWAVLKYA